MTVDQLVANYPRLYHMAAEGAWPSIQQHGLLPTTHLVESAQLPAAERARMVEQRRPVSTVITHPAYGQLTIRDQAPLKEHNLAPALTDMTIQQWLEILNNRVFFWLRPERLGRLLGARLYRNRPQDVLTLDTRSLVEANLANVRLSPINSGSTIFPHAVARGSTTFLPIEQYPFAERRKTRGLADAVTELAVIGGVPDVAAHVVQVDRYIGASPAGRLYP